MADTRFHLYIASSLDGFIADHQGGVDWLEPYQTGDLDYGYPGFIETIDTLVMGRRTYDQVRSFGAWPYEGLSTWVLTSRVLTSRSLSFPPLAPPGGDETGEEAGETVPDGVRSASDGIEALIDDLLDDESVQDVWIVGGAATLEAFLQAEVVDRLRIFVMPLLLGGGIRLFPGGHDPIDLELVGTETYDNGVVELDYRRLEDEEDDLEDEEGEDGDDDLEDVGDDEDDDQDGEEDDDEDDDVDDEDQQDDDEEDDGEEDDEAGGDEQEELDREDEDTP